MAYADARELHQEISTKLNMDSLQLLATMKLQKNRHLKHDWRKRKW